MMVVITAQNSALSEIGIAFISSNFPEKRLFTMNRDGSELELVETFFPIQSKNELEMSFTWSPDGTALLYMRGNRMYK